MGQFPPSPFARPVPSFPAPVQPPQVDPDADPLGTIRVNCSWLPYIIGACMQLTLQATWKGTPDDIKLAQLRANNLLSLFFPINTCGCGKDCTEQDGIDCGGDCCMGCCIRFENGVLQTLVCGVWTDVPGQSPAGSGGQPGNGAPQPQPGGGQATYMACFDADNTWVLPTLVNSGDVINVTSTSGAWNDPDHDFNMWRCPNGEQFILGACLSGTAVFVGTDPLPTSNHMSLSAIINGTFYAILGGPFTVPPGITNAQVFFVANDSNRSNDQGNVCFTVQVQNNIASSWCVSDDFTLSQWAWAPVVANAGCLLGTWNNGTGWTEDDCTVGTTPVRNAAIRNTEPITFLSQIEATFDITPGFYQSGGSAPAVVVLVNGVTVFSQTNAATTPGHNVLTIPINVGSVTSVEFALQSDEGGPGPFTGSATIEKLVLTGTGAQKPSGMAC